jgi:hypothetical protein
MMIGMVHGHLAHSLASNGSLDSGVCSLEALPSLDSGLREPQVAGDDPIRETLGQEGRLDPTSLPGQTSPHG